jgi:hypothetical protein
MIHTLTEIVGLPNDTAVNDIARAADQRSEKLMTLASGGDATARRELIELQIAYRIWAYSARQSKVVRHATRLS